MTLSNVRDKFLEGTLKNLSTVVQNISREVSN